MDIYKDTTTKNENFLRMSTELRERGVKNNDFMLSLYDKSLKGIDPYNKSLDFVTKCKIIIECVKNPWYYIRECVRIPVQGGTKNEYPPLNLGTLAMIYCTVKGLNQYTVLPRHSRQTVTYYTLINWLVRFNQSTKIDIFSKKDSLEMRMRLDYFDETVPKYFSDILTLTHTKNFISNTTISSKVVKREQHRHSIEASNYGRTTDCNVLFLDDLEQLKYPTEIINSLSPRLLQRKRQKKAGEIIASIFSITYDDNAPKENIILSQSIEDKCLKWDFNYYDLNDEELLDTLLKNSYNDTVLIKYTYQELGRDDEWVDIQSITLNNDKTRIDNQIYLKRQSI